MGKISTYDNASPVVLTDKVIGTSVGGSPTDATKNFLISDLLALFQGSIDLESVLTAGNTATNSIVLTGGQLTCQTLASLGNITATSQINCATLLATGTITCVGVDASGSRIDAQRVVVTQNVETLTLNATNIAPQAGGIISILTLPTYADNASAVLGGLAVDRVYKTATGELRIVV